MRRTILMGLLVTLLAACGTTEPPSTKVEAELLEVKATRIGGNSAREIYVRLRIRNTTGQPIWLLPSDFWYHPSGGGVTIAQASPYTGLGNSSSCTAGPSDSGVSCSLFFEWGEWMPYDVLVPGVIRWSDKSGYSHPNANGSAWVEEWIGFTPP